jgi:NADH-quinone oxidoreductase subunit N
MARSREQMLRPARAEALMNNYLAILPLLVVGVGGLMLMMVDAFTEEKAELATLSATVLGGAGAIAIGLAIGNHTAAPAAVSAYLATDVLAHMFSATICLGAALSALLAGGYLEEHGMDRGEFYAILVLSAFGAMVLANANDLLAVFLGLETMSLGVYCLVAFRRGSPRALEAAIKYFLLGSFAAAILLFGAALLYGATGHTDFAGIGKAMKTPGDIPLAMAITGLALLLIGFAFKISAAPFHMWTPDAYEGAVTPATTFMSVVVKASAFAVLVRVLVVSFGDELSADPVSGWPAALSGLAIASIVVGNVAAVRQTSVKRMLAYSSIAHAGYILVGVAALHAPSAREQAVAGVLYYLAGYTVSNVLAFGALIAVGSAGKEAVSYEDLAGVGRRHPIAALPFILGVLSLMGFPPTAGFFGKWYVFSAALAAGDALVPLVIVAALGSLVGAYYYLRVLVVLFMKEPEPDAPIAVPMHSGYVVSALAISATFVLVMGLLPSRYVELAIAAARSLV